MRTLKKTLCLILCLAMMVGLCAIGTSAIKYDDYKDKDKIKYEEAVTLLTALGVLEGDENGFRPQDGLNRAEGAAIMTRLLQKQIDMTAVSSFTDMDGYGWAQPYVKFCEDCGIIAGYGDGTFHPGDKLTTTAWAKMLICALGYDPAKEGFVDNPSWAIKVTMKVTSLNLADGLDVYAPGADIEREQAAQMAFNTLFQPMVIPEGTSVDVSWIGTLFPELFQQGGGLLNWQGQVGNATLTVKDGTYIRNTSYDYNIDDGDNVLEFIEACFPNIKVKTEDDIWGVPMHYWFRGKDAQDKIYKESKQIAETIAVPVLATYDVDMFDINDPTLYDDAGFEGGFGDIAVYENGNYAYEMEVAKRDKDVYQLRDYAGGQAILLDMNGNYANAEQTRLVVKYPYLAKVIAVMNGTNRFVTLKLYNTTTPVVFNYVTDDYAKGDFVLVYPDGIVSHVGGDGCRSTQHWTAPDFIDNILATKTPESKNGTLSRVELATTWTDYFTIGNAKALKIGDSTLRIGSNLLANLGPVEGKFYPVSTEKENYEVGFGMTAYTSYGYILGVESDAVTYGEYVFLFGRGHIVDNSFGKYSQLVGYVDQDAKTTETKVKLAATSWEEVMAGADEYPNQAPINFWTTVAVPGDTTTFAAKNAKINRVVPLTDGILQKDRPDLGVGVDEDGNTYKITADAKTVFIIRTGAETFVKYVGIHNVPTYLKGGVGEAYALVPPTEGAHAVAVYIDARAMIPKVNPVKDPDPVFILNWTPNVKTTDDGKTVYYEYDAIIDGTRGVLKCSKAFPDNVYDPIGLYIPVKDTNGLVYTLRSPNPTQYIVLNAAANKVVVENGVLNFLYPDDEVFPEATYTVAEDAVAYIYYADTGDLVEKTDPDSLNGLPFGEISCLASAEDMIIRKIYYFTYSWAEWDA